jgi:RNA polymerase sigma-70 factor, ECF subfamily
LRGTDDFDATLAAARSGDDAALTTLYRLLHARVLRYLRVLEPSDAEDLASDTWLDVVAGLERFEGDEHALRAWALTIARRRAIDLRRRRTRRPAVTVEPERLVEHAGIGDAEDDAMVRIGTRAALELLRALPRDQAEVVLLRVLGGLSVEQVARIMGKRRGTVRVLQHRALRALARTIHDPADARDGVTR